MNEFEVSPDVRMSDILRHHIGEKETMRYGDALNTPPLPGTKVKPLLDALIASGEIFLSDTGWLTPNPEYFS